MADVTDQARARWRERMENPDKPTPGWPLKVNDNRETKKPRPVLVGVRRAGATG